MHVNHAATSTTQLSGVSLLIGRLLWFVLFGICLVLLLASLIIIVPVFENIRQTHPPGLTPALAAIPLLRRYLLVVAFYATSFLVFRQRSRDLGALLMASLYVGLGTVPLTTGIFSLTVGVMVIPPLLNGLAVVALSLAVFFAILSLFVFPNGRFTPGWSRWMLIPTTFAAIAYGVGFYLNRNVPIPIFWMLVAITLIGIYTQFFRYRYTASLIHRQQIKWYIYGAVAFIIMQAAAITMQAQVASLETLSAMFWQTFGEVLFFFSYLTLLLANLIAIIRYRLFDINFVINRSIVYSGVTLLLGIVFIGVFFGLQAGLGRLVGSEQQVVSAGAAGALVILIFQPVRRQIRRLVDRHLYGIELDYTGLGVAQAGRFLPPDQRPTGTWGSFREMALVGRGGMGEVYRALHPTYNTPVAVKLLKEARQASAETRRRFQREAQTIARLKHPNIVTLYDIGEHEGDLYMVMEYVAGQTASQLLQEQGRLPLAKVTAILNDVAAALDYAHAHQVVHRDIKPSNIIIEADTGRSVLMDFGIAKIAAETRLTQSGGMIGTLDYIAPEQIQGVTTLDERADIYSLGVMVYQMLTGELPFKHNNAGAMVMAHMMQPAPDPRQQVTDLPAAAATAVMQAMSKKPEERFASASEMAAYLTLASH
jgi:hypothetical protein